ncbi:helix-turn-helix domain-containing protein [Paenibacillus graminis]|uniref:helix-turn-helix domain-containing protein n=1 Tax=Paenibacillus graminis TaxID=189425 RepID=UPI000470B930|nr:helix-turn-helix transcriptional regulator [Paenibacillus graminis]
MENNVYTETGKRIREARERKSLTQQELGDLVGLKRTSITNIESGRQKFMFHMIYEFSTALGVPLQELIPEKSDLISNESLLPKFKNLDKDAADFLDSILTKSKQKLELGDDSYEK